MLSFCKIRHKAAVINTSGRTHHSLHISFGFVPLPRTNEAKYVHTSSVSRTPCGCVDWNVLRLNTNLNHIVAPRVGAWIETLPDLNSWHHAFTAPVNVLSLAFFTSFCTLLRSLLVIRFAHTFGACNGFWYACLLILLSHIANIIHVLLSKKYYAIKNQLLYIIKLIKCKCILKYWFISLIINKLNEK